MTHGRQQTVLHEFTVGINLGTLHSSSTNALTRKPTAQSPRAGTYEWQGPRWSSVGRVVLPAIAGVMSGALQGAGLVYLSGVLLNRCATWKSSMRLADLWSTRFSYHPPFTPC